MASMLRLPYFLALIAELTRQVTAQVVTPHAFDPEEREKELNSLLQAHIQNMPAGSVAQGSVQQAFFLGRSKAAPQDVPVGMTAGQDALGHPLGNAPIAALQGGAPNPNLTPTADDIISPDYWKASERTIGRAGLSTPLPSAALVNMPAATPTPKPWHAVMQDSSQPLNTKVGSAIMDGLSGPVTPTPPPSQAITDVQFVAQCPMVMFNNDLSIRAPSCGDEQGKWVDPSPWNPRSVLRWNGQPASGLRFGVDSAIDGHGAAQFAHIKQEITMTGYKFTMRNCLDVDRWHIEELVYKVDSMGHVSSTMELHDVNLNSVAYFFRYVIKKPTGLIVAQSTLYRMSSLSVNFTEVDENGIDTGKVVAIVKKQGDWRQGGWRECMSPTSPRGWWIQFPVQTPAGNKSSSPSVATVQDIRVAVAGTITMMGHRDEGRGSNGLNTEGGQQQMAMVAGAIMLSLIVCILGVNCCMVFKGSGIRAKFKKTLFDTEGAMFPKQPSQQRAPAFNTTY